MINRRRVIAYVDLYYIQSLSLQKATICKPTKPSPVVGFFELTPTSTFD